MPEEPISISMSMPDEGFDGVGEGWWQNEGSMPDAGRPAESMSLPDVGSDGTGDWWWLNDESSMPYGDRPEMSLSMSIPLDGFDGTGDWWWLNGETSMSYGDRPMSISLSMSISMPDVALPELDGTDYDAEETFSNDVDEYQFNWAM